MTINYSDNVLEQVPTSSTPVYTAGTVNSAHIVYATVHNEGAAIAQITVNIVQNGNTVGVTNQYIKTNVAPGESKTLGALVGRILTTSDSVQATSSVANTLNLSVGVKEITT